MEQIGKLIVITGGTVSGKDTVVAELLKINPTWRKIVTTTTRPIRLNEQNGIDYNFVNLETFREIKANGKFLETVEYAGNNYGTFKSSFNPFFKGQTCIWRIDPSRAAKVNLLFDQSFNKAQTIKNNTVVIYLDIPDKKTVYQRLRARGISEIEIEKRIQQDEENRKDGHFEQVVINYNGRLNETLQKIMSLIKT